MLTEFLDRCHILETIDRKRQRQPTASSQLKGAHTRAASYVSTNKVAYQICKGNHFIFSCEQFLKLSHEAVFLNVLLGVQLCFRRFLIDGFSGK